MTVVFSAHPGLERLRELRKKRAWRAVIELGENLLAQGYGQQTVLINVELGKAWLEVRQYENARKVLQAAQQLQPRNSGVIRRLGELESAVGNYDSAAKYWQALRKKKGDRTDSSVFVQLVKALRNLDRLEAAKKIASAGLVRFPNNRQLQEELHRIILMLDDNGRAVDVGSVVKRNPGRHPYTNLDAKSHWAKTVSTQNPLEIENWYTKKFSISALSISSAGSCFAQHIGRALREKGFEYVDVEPPPGFLRVESHHEYGYGIYSARFGNIYTSRQLLQLAQRSLQAFHPVDSVWEKDGGYVDAFRPSIEPEPFRHLEDVEESREAHLAAVTRMFKLSNLFIYTMGLTETWMSKDDGAVYPVAPGVSGGTFDTTRYAFKNLTFTDVLNDMEEFFALVRGMNSSLKIILTVSPVPLMATATFNNVVVASSYSKSVLRAVAGLLSQKYDFVDYFPSYEIVGSHIMRGQFFNPDGRTVSPYGVSHVMKQFFAEHVPPRTTVDVKSLSAEPDEIICDEELLKEFGPA